MPIAPWLKDDGCDPVPLENLIQQIVGHHNGSLRRTIPYLGALIDDLASDFRVSHPELRLLRRLFHAFVTELVLHLLKEEHVVLPLIGRYAISRKCEATAAQELLAAIAAMEREHAELATRLVTLQNLVSAVWAPDTLGQRWRTLVHGFSVLAAEAYLAIDKENNVLFPRAKRNAQDSICLER